MIKKLPFQFAGIAMPGLALCPMTIVMILLASENLLSQSVLLKDVNTTEEISYNEISEFTNVGTVSYFISNKNELWKTDGTTAATVRVRTFRSLRNLVRSGSLLYFAADDGTNGVELWKSNGTGSGTVMVRNIGPASASTNPLYITDVNGIIYFVADNGVNGREVWKTNGTSSGTVLVKDIMVGKGSSGPNRLTNVNGVLYFQANDNINGYELWKSGGTSATTMMVKDIKTGSKAGSFPELLTNVNGTLFFVAADNTTGRELWKSNGTAAGTVRVRDIIAGIGSPAIDNCHNLNGTLLFTANDGVHGKELWKSNGTAIGTVMVKDIKPGSAGADGYVPMGNFKVLNNRLFFTASDDATYGKLKLFITDGTTAGTKIFTSLVGSLGRPLKPELSYYKGAYYFFAHTYDEPTETEVAALFRINTDGTGQTMIKRLQHEYYETEFNPLMTTGYAYLLFAARLTAGGYELNRSDGTTAGTLPLKDTFVNTNSSEIWQAATVGSMTYFTTRAPRLAIHRTNGTPSGTSFIKNHSVLWEPTKSGTRLFYTARDTWDGPMILYTIAGPTSTPVALRTGLGEAYNLADVNGKLFFVEDARSLWVSNGTASGTVLLKTFPILYGATNYNGVAMIFAHNGLALELWKSDGTVAGTVKIKQISTPDNRFFDFKTQGVVRNLFFFSADNGTNGYEMWRSDGTATGTFRITDLRTGDAGRQQIDIGDAEVVNDSLYFPARDAAGVWGLYRTNGTAAGTTRFASIGGPAHRTEKAGDRLVLFVEGSNEVVSSIWVSDRTSTGTKMVRSIQTRYDAISAALVNDVLYFSTSPHAGDYRYPITNPGMWRSDGTDCGTFNINVGVTVSTPVVALGSQLIFTGYALKSGAEPYAYNASVAPASPCGAPSDARIAATSFDDGTFNPEEEEALTFKPNPFRDELSFTINGDGNQKARLVVYTVAGVPVEVMEELEANREYTIGQQWPSGMFIIRASIGRNAFVKKVIKE